MRLVQILLSLMFGYFVYKLCFDETFLQDFLGRSGAVAEVLLLGVIYGMYFYLLFDFLTLRLTLSDSQRMQAFEADFELSAVGVAVYFCFSTFFAFFATVFLAHYYFSLDVFDPTCRTITSVDYSWFVWDALAKGATFDVLESFNIDLYRCRPNKNSVVASVLQLIFRSISSLVLVVLLFDIARSRSHRRDGASRAS